MESHCRRYDDINPKHRDHRVSDDPSVNGKLSNKERFEHLEHDLVLNTNILEEVAAQNDKYADYLEALMAREKDALDFWRDVRKKLAVSGILGAIGLVMTALWFAFRTYISGPG